MNGQPDSATENNHAWPAVLFFILYSAAISISYLGGVDSQFILDDAPNLEGLKAINDGSTSIAAFVVDGKAGPSGRPISLLSFALQASSWPDHPLHFKVVNVIIHLLNGLLIFLIARRLTRLLGANAAAATAVAMLTSLWWGLLPIHVSSVLYVIQRMNLLSSFFLLATVWLYLACRIRLSSESSPRQLLLLGAIAGGGLLLSVISKENGIILTGLLFVIEVCFFRRPDMPSYWPAFRALILLGPLLLFVIYLVVNSESAFALYDSRQFSMGERLMTEARVLWMYVHSILIPVVSQYGVFHDDIVISRGISEPITTLISIAALLVTLLAAFVFRQRFVVFSFAVFWFCVSQLVESTIIPLEIYFEHRNYVASAGLVFALSYGLWYWIDQSDKLQMKAMLVPGVIVLAMYGLATFEVARLWTKPFEQAAISYQAHPDSKRAATQWISQLIDRQRIAEAREQVLQARQKWPASGSFYLIRANLDCDKRVDSTGVDSLRADLARGLNFSSWDITYVTQLLTVIETGNCQYIDRDSNLDDWLAALAGNQSWAEGRPDLLTEIGRYYQGRNQFAAARQYWQDAYDINGDLGLVFMQVASLYRQGEFEAARDKARLIEDAIESGEVRDKAKIGAYLNLKKALAEALESN